MPVTPPEDLRSIDALLAIMRALRDRENGCPWDVEQTWATIAPYTVEEAYEVADAIERGDVRDLKEELGDLLLQVVFHAQIGKDEGAFEFADVVEAISDKMVRRHPHVFGEVSFENVEAQTASWEALKAAERADKGKDASLLDDIPVGLPGLTRAVKLQRRAARVGFDWSDVKDVLAKLREEADELVEARESGDADEIEAEFGDLLFVMANLARHLKIDPENAIRRANAKFVRRFQHIEQTLGERIEGASLEEMEAVWVEAKKAEKT